MILGDSIDAVGSLQHAFVSLCEANEKTWEITYIPNSGYYIQVGLSRMYDEDDNEISFPTHKDALIAGIKMMSFFLNKRIEIYPNGRIVISEPKNDKD